ncbi:C2 domain-containing protein [Streptomyces parvulus]|uniref:C2 domain-containing protein n=1 Tax=Streptomyces parvulus TaxID=146923 RepID=UPI0033BA6EEE
MLVTANYRVETIEARGLLPKDFNGSSDPYVKLSLGDQKYKTSALSETLTPRWDVDFNFRVNGASEELLVEVYDRDPIGSDELLGTTTVKLDGTDTADVWHQLKGRGENTGDGELRLAIAHSE